MSDKFKAIVINQEGDNFKREIKELNLDFLDQGEVLIKVDFSDLNYKDALILNNGGKLVKDFPRIPGIDFAGKVVEIFSKRLQTQERLTVQIANTLMEALDAKGVAVTIDSTHQCMTMRGIKKEQATTVTNFYLGQFKEDLSYQNRYLRFISTELKD